jgi:hypothetical protein
LTLRIPLSPDQTLAVEFHEIERRLRKLEKATGTGSNSSVRIIQSGGGGSTTDLTPILSRLNALEAAVAVIPDTDFSEFGGVGEESDRGLVPAPGTSLPPTGLAGHVLVEDGEWGFPFRGLVQVATSGEQDSPPYDVLNVQAGLSAGSIVAGDIECTDLTVYALKWDDLRFPSQGINPSGAASDPGVDDDTGLLVFSGTLDNVIAGVAQMPHGWAPGTAIKPHIHLRFPTSNGGTNTRWAFEYDIANANEDFTNASGTYTAFSTITVANPANVNTSVVAGFGPLDMDGFRESAIILWRISRLASSDAVDDDTNDCFLMEFDIHYQSNKDGTTVEFPT